MIITAGYEECPGPLGPSPWARMRGPIMASLATIPGSFSIGAVLSWTSVGLPDMQKSGDLGEFTKEQATWIGSVLALGAILGGLLTGWFIEKAGRKNTLLGCNLPMFLGWLLIIFAPSASTVVCGRFFTGLSVGCLTLVIPIYITECTEESSRGVIASTFPILWAFGILFTNFAGWIHLSWWWLSAIYSLAPISLAVSMMLVPETPVYYLEKGLDADGQKSIKWLRSVTDEQASKEYEWLKSSIQHTDGGMDVNEGLSLKDFMKRPVFKPALISISLFMFQQLSGVNALVFYTVEIFESTGTAAADGEVYDSRFESMMVCIVNLLSVCCTSTLADKIGRRPLLLISLAGVTISQLLLGLFFYLKDGIGDGVAPQHLKWLPLLALTLFMASFSAGLGPMPFLLMGEILPAHVKGVVSAIAISLMWFMTFLVTKSFDGLSKSLGAYGCFWMFAGFSALGVLFTLKLVKETKGKTFEEIYKLYA